MRNMLLWALLAAAPLPAAQNGFDGRWIIEPRTTSGRVMWLEVNGAGEDEITGSIIGGGPGGQLDPIVDARIVDGELSFRVERYSGRGARRRFARTPTTVRLVGDELHGVTRFRGNEVEWVGRRAPVIADRDDGSWREGEPVALFDGKDLSHWESLRPGRLRDWFVEDQVMKNRERADVFVSKDKFWNFRLDVEYRVRPRMNGGIGLRARYEIQILDDSGAPPSKSGNGSLYSRIQPSINASKPADEWQTFEITLIGRDLSVVLNGEKIIDKQTVEGFTAMATDWREAEPGPITLQGDHGAVEFRRIVVTPLAKK